MNMDLPRFYKDSEITTFYLFIYNENMQQDNPLW